MDSGELVRPGADAVVRTEVKTSAGQMSDLAGKQPLIDFRSIYERHDPRTQNKDQGGSNHVHWTIQAFYWMDPETGNFHDVVNVSVEATDEESAIARAQQIIDRPGYRVVNVTETCSLDDSVKSKNNNVVG